MANILFFMNTCPDTAPFIAELQRLNIPFEGIDIGCAPKNLKSFLVLRDKETVFDDVKANGRIGIPALLHETKGIILDIERLKEL